MLVSNLKTFEHRYFYSMIDRDDPQVIPDFFAANIENWIIRDAGELVMRDGLTARGASPSATNLGSGKLYRHNGTRKFLRVINGAGNSSKFQHSIDGTTWTDVTSGGSRQTDTRWVFAQANDYLYGLSVTDSASKDLPIKYDGSTISTVSAMPNGTNLTWWKNFMWVGGVAAAKDKLSFSGANDPETYGGSDFININLGDGSEIVGTSGVGGSTGRLYIGKKRSIWFITGSSSANFALQPLTYEHGVASHESMVAAGNDVWCVDNNGEIRALYRSQEDNPFTTLKSRDISTTIAGLNKNQIGLSTAVKYNEFILFFVPNGVDSFNSLVLVWDTLANRKKGGWVKFTGWRVARATVFEETNQQKLFLHDARPGNGQTYEWTGTSDNGIAIIAKYETKIYDFNIPERPKRFRYSYQFADAQGDFAMRFYTSIDRFYYTLLKEVSLLGSGNKLLGVTWTLGVDKLGSGGFVRVQVPFGDMGGQTEGYTMQVKLEAESSTNKLRVRHFTSHYIVKGLR